MVASAVGLACKGQDGVDRTNPRPPKKPVGKVLMEAISDATRCRIQISASGEGQHFENYDRVVNLSLLGTTGFSAAIDYDADAHFEVTFTCTVMDRRKRKLEIWAFDSMAPDPAQPVRHQGPRIFPEGEGFLSFRYVHGA